MSVTRYDFSIKEHSDCYWLYHVEYDNGNQQISEVFVYMMPKITERQAGFCYELPLAIDLLKEKAKDYLESGRGGFALFQDDETGEIVQQNHQI